MHIMFHPCHIQIFECDTSGTILKILFECDTGGTILKIRFKCDTGGTIFKIRFECDTGGTFYTGHPAIWIIFIFSENYIQTI